MASTQAIPTHDGFLRAFSGAFAAQLTAEPHAPTRYSEASFWTPWMMRALREAAKLALHGGEITDHTLHAEWYKLDLVAVSPAYEGERGYWQTRAVITIEHENGFDVETEMWKLAHWRSPLSVLAFYDFNESDRTEKIVTQDKTTPGVSQRDWLAAKLRLLSEIVRSVDPQDAARHLLLIGNRSVTGEIVWRSSSWNGSEFGAPLPLRAR